MSRSIDIAAANRFPPLLLGAALVLWGAVAGFLVYALLMAALLEAARWVPWRWDLANRELNRVADLSALLFLATAIYFFDRDSINGLYGIVRALPFLLFLLGLAQVYGTRDAIPLSALLLAIRRAEAKGRIEAAGSVDVRYPYFVACLLAACAGELRTVWLFFALFALMAWLLWSKRPRRYSAAVSLAALLTAGLIGYAAQVELIAIRKAVEPWVFEWLRERYMHRRDPFRSHMALGHIGRLKLSDRIVFRVQPDEPHPGSLLLRDASYQTVSHNLWFAGNSRFVDLTPDIEGTTWPLFQGGPPPGIKASAPTHGRTLPGSRRLRVSTYLPRGKGMLAVPNGAYQIDELPVETLQQSQLGALKVVEGPEVTDLVVRYAPTATADSPPTPSDLSVPKGYRVSIQRLADDLGLAGLPPVSVAQTLDAHFTANFRYSLTGYDNRSTASPMERFLFDTRSGHCEYFATATVLALRAAGVPARYATGYAVKEYSALEASYVVRRRHAHAWALAYINGHWQDIDTTPAVWAELEADAAPWWENVYDLWSWLYFRYSNWRWQETEDEARDWLLWLMVPLVLLLIWRLFSRKRVSRNVSTEAPGVSVAAPGLDSEFYAIDRWLTERGYTREPAETAVVWIERLARTRDLPGATELLHRILPAHYRYRFDPAGMGANERRQINEDVQHWLDRHATDRPNGNPILRGHRSGP